MYHVATPHRQKRVSSFFSSAKTKRSTHTVVLFTAAKRRKQNLFYPHCNKMLIGFAKQKKKFPFSGQSRRLSTRNAPHQERREKKNPKKTRGKNERDNLMVLHERPKKGLLYHCIFPLPLVFIDIICVLNICLIISLTLNS